MIKNQRSVRFNPNDWYWKLSNDEGVHRAWSSARGEYVRLYPEDRTTQIANEGELCDVLRAYGLKTPVATKEDIDAERDKRMATMEFGGIIYDTDDASLAAISNTGALALATIMRGDHETFSWIAANNQTVPMDAQTMWTFAQTAITWNSRHMLKARELKDMRPIPSDYADAKYW